MFPRFIELTNYQYRIQQEISSGATAKVYLAKRRTIRTKDLPLQIANTKNDMSQPLTQKNEIGAKQQQSALYSQKNDREIQRQEKFKPRMLQSNEIKKQSTKYMSTPLQITTFNKHKSQEYWTGQPCALKVITLDPKTHNQKLKRQYQTEIKMLEELRHPGIISLIDHGIIQNQRKIHPCVAIEWGLGGNFSRLIDLVHQRPHYFSQRHQIFRYYAAQLIDIIGYLQSKGVSHRDLKAENLILDKYYKLRLIDFGDAQIFDLQKSKFSLNLLSQQKEYERQGEMKAYVGSKHYISPEMIQRSRQSKDLQCYSKTDIWSIGVVLYYMFTRKYPFQGSNTFYIIDQIKGKEVNYQGISDPLLVPLLKKIFQKSPELRADISEIKKHEYFGQLDFTKIFQLQSPIIKIIQSHSEQYFYTGQALVKIFCNIQYRVVGIFRRSSMMKNKNKQMSTRRGSAIQPTFNKNQPEITDINGDKNNGSQYCLEGFESKMAFKYYLSIAKKEANSIPKHLQIDKNTRLQVSKLSCLLLGVRFSTKSELQPDTVQIRFIMQEELDKFVTRFADMFRAQ